MISQILWRYSSKCCQSLRIPSFLPCNRRHFLRLFDQYEKGNRLISLFEDGSTHAGGKVARLKNFINGESQDASGGGVAELINPSTGEAYLEAPISSQSDVDAAMAAAAGAFTSWKRTTPSERSLALFRIADALEAHADELVAIESENTGKPVALTLSEEIPPMCDQIRFFAGAARVLEGLSAGEYLAGHTSMIRREPIGVCAAVTPWNYPLMMAVWKWAPALAAGNTMVLKHSDTTPASSVRMAEIMAEYLPAGVFNVVVGDRDTGRMLVDHPTPQMVSITGSVRAGMDVAATAAPSLKRVHLELGGKAPVLVFDDADIEAAAAGIAGARRGAARERRQSVDVVGDIGGRVVGERFS